MAYSERYSETERRVMDLMHRVVLLEQRVTQLQQNNNAQWATVWNVSQSQTAIAYWTISPSGGIAAATGTWPDITPTAFTAAIYQDVGGTLTEVSAGATVRWFYKDADVGNRLIPLMTNGDGSYDALADSCTAVNV